MTNSHPLSPEILAAIGEGPEAALHATMQHFGCQAGTIHWLEADGILHLAAQSNLPPPIVAVIQTVPLGKGIAGLAAQRREPVYLCNLQTDTSGQARPAAKTTGMEGSIAVPMLTGGELRGVLGIAKIEAHDWTDAEKASLLEIASTLGAHRP